MRRKRMSDPLPELITEQTIIEDLEFLENLGLVRQLPDGSWCKTEFAAEIGREGWYAVVIAALSAPDEQGH